MKSTFVLVVLVLSAEVFGGSFAPSKNKERQLLKCLRHRRRNRTCFKITQFEENAQSCISGDPSDILKQAKDYAYCALVDYRNHTPLKVAVAAAGSCALHYPSVAKSWEKFLKRRGFTTRIRSPSHQTNGSIISVRFSTKDFDIRNLSGKLEAVDLVISRLASNDSETYGRYGLTVDNNQKRVHESIQATCPPLGRRYFVAGLNTEGVRLTMEWLRECNSVIEFSVKLTPEEQIVEDSTGVHHYRKEAVFDIGQRVSGMVLHFSGQNGSTVFPFNGRAQHSSSRQPRDDIPHSDSTPGRSDWNVNENV